MLSCRRVAVPVMLGLAACASNGIHEPTEIPFDINNLSDAQREVITSGHAVDTSPYLIESRPIVCQIVETGNDADELRDAGPIDREVDVLIYALGEAEGERLVDHGWLEHVESGRKVWEMTPDDATHAGGDPRNRKAVARLVLEPGTYRLRYVSNTSHAYPDWVGAAPERERFYGVTVFNLSALPRIEERLRKAGAPGLRTSLDP